MYIVRVSINKVSMQLAGCLIIRVLSSTVNPIQNNWRRSNLRVNMSSYASVGALNNFDHLTSEWKTYKSRLNQWFIANDITDEKDKSKVKRRALLLSALSESTYKLTSDLALPETLENVEFDAIIELLDTHFTPKRLGFAERYQFYSASHTAAGRIAHSMGGEN